MSKQIVLLAPRGFGHPANESRVLKRFELYMDSLNTLSKTDYKLIVFLPQNNVLDDSSTSHYNAISVFRIGNVTRNFIFFAIRARLISHIRNIKPKLILASDIRFGFLSAILYRIGNSGSSLQVQIHGNYNSLNTNFYIPKILLNSYYSLIFRNSNSVRMVSNTQFSSFPLRLQMQIKNLVIAEIPYELNKFSNFSDDRPKTIGFVGRIHPERGIQRWIDISRLVDKKIENLTRIIVGAGKEQDYFLTELKKSGVDVNYCGWLSSDELRGTWSQIGVLLVSAEHESFGATMREALMNGVFVVAYENSASRQLCLQFPSMVFTSTLNETLANAIVMCLQTKTDVKMVKRINQTLKNEQKEAIIRIAGSWLIELQSY